MCGIAGIWSLQKKYLNEENFRSSLGLLKHRGPDESGTYQEGEILLGAHRLKIIDLEMGRQPLYDQKGRSLVFNGAIYNYPELAERYNINSKSDSSVLFELLKEKGELAIDQLNGMFAFAYYDAKNDKLLLARDRAGQKPLYYYQGDDFFLFASELKALKSLMQQLGVSPKINEQAIYHYLCFSNIPEPETIYENVYALPPGYQLIMSGANLSFTKYWDYTYQPKHQLSKEELMHETKKLIKKAVKHRLRADVPVGLFLSGGWDSSVIAYEAAQSSKDIKAYTVQYPFKSSQNEVEVAANTAKSLGLAHEVIEMNLDPLENLKELISTFDQPFADSSSIPNLAIAKAASKSVKVMLNGDGGDEQFGGYRRYFLARHTNKLEVMKHLSGLFSNASMDRRSTSGFINRVTRIMNSKAGSQYLRYTVDMFQASDISSVWTGSEIKSTAEQLIEKKTLKQLDPLDQLMHLDRKFNLPSGILVKMDRVSMAQSIEARSPFLDHELFDYTSRLPDKFKIYGAKRKYLLKEIYKNKLPKAVVKAPKTSFEAPLNIWLKNDFSELIADLLLNSEAKIYNYLNFNEVNLLLKGEKYKERNTDYMIYSLLVLELWLQNND